MFVLFLTCFDLFWPVSTGRGKAHAQGGQGDAIKVTELEGHEDGRRQNEDGDDAAYGFGCFEVGKNEDIRRNTKKTWKSSWKSWIVLKSCTSIISWIQTHRLHRLSHIGIANHSCIGVQANRSYLLRLYHLYFGLSVSSASSQKEYTNLCIALIECFPSNSCSPMPSPEWCSQRFLKHVSQWLAQLPDIGDRHWHWFEIKAEGVSKRANPCEPWDCCGTTPSHVSVRVGYALSGSSLV